MTGGRYIPPEESIVVDAEDNAAWKLTVAKANPSKVAAYAAEIDAKIAAGKAKPLKLSE